MCAPRHGVYPSRGVGQFNLIATPKQIAMLSDLLDRFHNSLDGVDEGRFLLEHEEDVSEIDKLVSLRLIDRNNTGKLVVPFAAISSLRGKVAMADEIISACSAVFTVLK